MVFDDSDKESQSAEIDAVRETITNMLKAVDNSGTSGAITGGTNPKRKQILSPEFVVELEADDVSSPTISCASFSEEEFSIASASRESEFHFTGRTGTYLEENDDLSMSSMNTKAIRQIQELKMKLRVQENTKLELLNQCMKLDHKVERDDSKSARVRIYKSENARLREQSAHMEKDFMNEMNKIVVRMAAMEREHSSKLQERDEKLKQLEEDLANLKCSSKFENVSLEENADAVPQNRTILFKATSEESDSE